MAAASCYHQNLNHIVISSPIPQAAMAKTTTTTTLPLVPNLLVGGDTPATTNNTLVTKLLGTNDLTMPMLASPIRKLDDLDRFVLNAEYLLEEKYDGERMLVHITRDDAVANGCKQQCYSRMLKPHRNFKHTVQFNDNVALIESCVLDGELVYLNPNTDAIVPICDTGSRLALKQRFYIFDIQRFNGTNLTLLDLNARKSLLNVLIKATDHCQLSPYVNMEAIDRDMLMSRFDQVCQGGGEGLMLKNTRITYLANNRKYWHKVKALHLREHMDEYDLYAHRFFRDKNNIYNILECGHYDPNTGAFKQMARVSSGLNNANRLRLQLMLKSSSEYTPATGSEFQCRVIVTIVADKITVNGHLRHPIFKRIRTDLSDI